MLTLIVCEKDILFDFTGQSMYWSFFTKKKKDGSQISHTKLPYCCCCYRLSGRSMGLSLLRRSRSRQVWTLFPSPFVITPVIEYLFFLALINNSAATWKERFLKDCPINFLFLETGGFLVSVLFYPSLFSSFIASPNGSTSPLTFPLSVPPVLFISLNRDLQPTHTHRREDTHTHKLVRIESSQACRWLCLLKECFFHNLSVP